MLLIFSFQSATPELKKSITEKRKSTDNKVSENGAKKPKMETKGIECNEIDSLSIDQQHLFAIMVFLETYDMYVQYIFLSLLFLR